MDVGLAAWVGLLAGAALAAFATYRWRQRGRAREVGRWVEEYLLDRYDGLPGGLSINDSGDELWPVLVGFDHPVTGARHRLRFASPGPRSAFALLSETADGPPGALAAAEAALRAAEDRADLSRFEDDGGRAQGQGQPGRQGSKDEADAAAAARS